MPMLEDMTAVCLAKEARKKLKVLAAECDAPMCGILSALIDYAVSSPEFVTQLLHPAIREQGRGN